MFDLSLFLGIPVSIPLDEMLKKIDPQMMKFFISDKQESYLHETTFEGTRYIGKFIEEMISISDLELLEKNIYSILNKLIPNHPCEGTPLVVFAVPSPPK